MKCSEEIKTGTAANTARVVVGGILTGLGDTAAGAAVTETAETAASGCCEVYYPPYFIFIAIAVAPWRIIEKLFKKLKKEI